MVHTKRNRLLSTFLALTMVMSLSNVVFAAGSDITGHWAEEDLQSFINAGYLNGYGDDRYAPNQSMTRAEFTAIFNRILELNEESDLIANYTDVAKTSWYYSDFAKALSAGYINGTSTTTMSPNQTITRQEAFTMLARFLDLESDNEEVLHAFSDANEIAGYALSHLTALVENDFVKGAGGKLMPTKSVTRAEGVTVLSRLMAVYPDMQRPADVEEPETPLGEKGDLVDGVYTGTGAGYGGTITVKVTISDGKMTAIEIVSHSETDAYLERAQSIINKLLEKQTTTGVDTVAGATLSSKGILTAVEACISQAKGKEDTSQTGSTGSGDSGSSTGGATRPGDQDFDNLKDGVYEGSAPGYSGMTSVRVTVTGGKITAIEILSHGDTTSYFDSARGVINQIISKQSTTVDGVSGATRSVYGIINAVANALERSMSDEAVTHEVSTWKQFSLAMAKAIDGDTIKLVGNITDAGNIDGVSSATMSIDKAVTIDGNNKSISAFNGLVYVRDENGYIGAETKQATFCFSADGEEITMQNLTIDGASFSQKLGGSIYVESGAVLTLDTVTIKNGRAGSAIGGNGGAAVYVEPHSGGNSTLVATNCTFENNMVNNGVSGRGGAVYGYNATIVLDSCIFSGNKAGFGGAVAAAGKTNLTVTNCTFAANNDGTYGGDDIYIFDGYTFYKKTMAADSAVQYSISGNTHNGTDGGDFTGYRVIMGRVLGDVSDTTNGTAQSPIVKTGNVGSKNPMFAVGHDLSFDPVTNYDRTSAPTENTATYKFVLMNIPFDEFYKADVNNSVPVDAFTSATKTKVRTGSMTLGSYHGDDTGDAVLGVTFPVAVPVGHDISAFTEITDASSVSITISGRGQPTTTVYNGREALYESPSYSYYDLGAEVPTYYKVMNSDGSFGKTYGAAKTLTGIKTTFMTRSNYGDYQMNLIGIDSANHFSQGTGIYAVIIHTKEGNDYGLRHLENLWRGTELAWCTGFTTMAHNCPTSSAHYVGMMGQTITGVTYYTPGGIFDIPLEGVYVPVKFDASFTVDSADVTAGATAFNINLPGDYAAVYTVTNRSGADVTDTYSFSVGNGVTWSTSNMPPVGQYTLTVNDSSDKYAPFTASFVLSTTVLPAQAAADTLSIQRTDAAEEETFLAYISAITSVNVNGTDYLPGGRNGNIARIIAADGSILLGATPFAGMNPGDTFTIAITATGYSVPLTFTMTVPDTVYATATLTYRQFYAGDVTDAAAFDTVTSATTSMNGIFTNSDTTEPESGIGYTRNGVKNVAIGGSPTGLAASGIAYTGLTATAPAQYKTIDTAGNLGTTIFNVVATVTDAQGVLVTGGNWGDYQVNVIEQTTSYLRNSREDTFPVNSAIQGVIWETSSGFTVGFAHLQNVWIQSYQVAFSQGNANYTEFEKLIGETVTKITYIMPDGAYVFEFAPGIFIKPQYLPAQPIVGEFGDGMTTFTLSDLPTGLTNPKLSIGYRVGRTTAYLLPETDANTLTYTLDLTAIEGMAEGGSYIIKLISDNFADYDVSIPITADQRTALQALIDQADVLLAVTPDNHLKGHRDEAEELLADPDATSADAASLIAELTELMK